MAGIDPRAVIAAGAELEAGVTVGPFAIVGERVRIGAGTIVSAHAFIEGRVTLGRDNVIGPFVCIGTPPQHTGYKGEDTAVRIGDRNQIREYVTVHRGTADGHGETTLGSDNYLMVGCHVAHDCVVGSRVAMANLVSLAGHVEVEDDVVFGGFAGAHQRCRVGRGAMVAAMSKLVQDAPPFAMVGGDPVRFVGLNRVGLKRLKLTEETKTALRRAYRMIFAPGTGLEEGLQDAEREYGDYPEVRHVVEFIRESKRGVVREK
jgi:UDP-N-acetylglucosamine acyltransferase